jgi:hypothetical protein
MTVDVQSINLNLNTFVSAEEEEQKLILLIVLLRYIHYLITNSIIVLGLLPIA